MGLIFFFSRLYCFILKWRLSPLSSIERLPVHLDCPLGGLWASAGPPGGCCCAQRLVRRGPGEAGDADLEPRRWLQLGFRGIESPLQKREGALNRSEEAICALSGSTPACPRFLGDKHNTTVFTLFTALGTSHPALALHCSSALA